MTISDSVGNCNTTVVNQVEFSVITITECPDFSDWPYHPLDCKCEGRGWFFDREIKIKSTIINDVCYVNTTPHQINGIFGDSEVVIPASGFLLNAKPIERFVERESGIDFVCTEFVATKEGMNFVDGFYNEWTKKNLNELGFDIGKFIIIGSNIALGAYPNVCGLTPVEGCERVPNDQKKMDLKKFNINDEDKTYLIYEDIIGSDKNKDVKKSNSFI